MDYARIFQALGEKQVRYLVIGGVALNLHGVPRMTADLDLFVELSRENLARFLAAMAFLGYRPRLPVAPEELLDEGNRASWIADRNLVAFTFVNSADPALEVDLVLVSPFPFAEAEGRSRAVPFAGGSLSLLSALDLIAWKQKSDRAQDRSDVEALKRLLKIKGEKGD